MESKNEASGSEMKRVIDENRPSEEVKGEGEEAEEIFETNWELEVNKFDDMGLKEEVLRGIYGYGFKDPSPIQQKGILPVI